MYWNKMLHEKFHTCLKLKKILSYQKTGLFYVNLCFVCIQQILCELCLVLIYDLSMPFMHMEKYKESIIPCQFMVSSSYPVLFVSYGLFKYL